TPMGANLVPVAGGCTFRIWAPRAHVVYVRGAFNGWAVDEYTRLLPGPTPGHWAGFVPSVGDGVEYKFWVDGESGPGWKRDPHAQRLSFAPAYPFSNCVVRDPRAFPWQAAGFPPPAFSDLVIYQLHIGAFGRSDSGRAGRFLDVIDKVPYLADLGVNA